MWQREETNHENGCIPGRPKSEAAVPCSHDSGWCGRHYMYRKGCQATCWQKGCLQPAISILYTPLYIYSILYHRYNPVPKPHTV